MSSLEPVYLVPETVPSTDASVAADDMTLYERAVAMCRTAKQLEDMGATFTFTDEDKEAAFDLVQAYAQDPETTSKEVTPARAEQLPDSMLIAGGILKEYGHLVAKDTDRIRNLVTNKLLIESDHPDAKVRLKAIELLGKMSDVGAFTEKRQLTVVDESSEGLKQKLMEQLMEMKAAATAQAEREINGDYTRQDESEHEMVMVEDATVVSDEADDTKSTAE